MSFDQLCVNVNMGTYLNQLAFISLASHILSLSLKKPNIHSFAVFPCTLTCLDRAAAAQQKPAGATMAFDEVGGLGLLGASWVLISRVISRSAILIIHIRGLMALLITTHEPPSKEGSFRG